MSTAGFGVTFTDKQCQKFHYISQIFNFWYHSQLRGHLLKVRTMSSDHSHLSQSCLQISFTRQVIMVVVAAAAVAVAAVVVVVVLVVWVAAVAVATVVVVEYRACQWLYVRV